MLLTIDMIVVIYTNLHGVPDTTSSHRGTEITTHYWTALRIGQQIQGHLVIIFKIHQDRLGDLLGSKVVTIVAACFGKGSHVILQDSYFKCRACVGGK